MLKLLLTILLLSVTTLLHAQTWEIGAGIGGAGYMGDLNQNNPLQISGISLSGFLKYNFNGYLSVKGNLNFAKIGAADSTSNNAYRQNRNLDFRNRILEGSVMGEFNFMHYIPDAGKNKFTPFVFLGFGLAINSPYTEINDRRVYLRNQKTEGQSYPPYIMAIPFGAGVKYNIGGKFNLIGDIGYRYAFTDYLDDVSGAYVNPATQGTLARRLADRSPGRNAVTGSQRGDLRRNDMYMFINISLSYTFVTAKCYFDR
ncbi:MAG: hypothetical protein EOP46_08480 [Sphingobacteriaceae bacterium]|nr:MAG: hypothetical protein EOP46_08480 [Sphingobacteriaceae bacterium]